MAKIMFINLPKKEKKIIISILFIIILLITGRTQLKEYLPPELQNLASFPSPTHLANVKDTSNQNVLKENLVKVTKIVDGDTIQLENGMKLRYIGIDTPESVDPRKTVECFAKEANKRNTELVLGKIVRLEKDISETDRYGRLLRYVYVEDTMINEQLVREGYAVSSSYPPDIKHQVQLKAAELGARENKRGLWGNCSITD